MASRPSSSSTGAIAARFASPRFQRRLLVGSSAIFAAGVIAILVTVFHGTKDAFDTPTSTTPATIYHPDKKVPLDPALIPLGRKFIRSAVLRQHLGSSYDIVAPDLKGRLTRKQWLTGNIPVVGYPAANIDSASFVVDYSYKTTALLEVDLVAKPNSGPFVRPHLPFFIGFERAGKKPNGRWLVSYWEAHWKPPIPTN